MTISESGSAEATDRGVQIERVFAAPRDAVWRAWTEAEHFRRWYGPSGFTVLACDIDLRVGGHHRFELQSPDGHSYSTGGVFLEIAPPERFVMTEAPVDDTRQPMTGPGSFSTVVTVVLEDLGSGGTRLTLSQTGWPDPSMAGGATFGWGQALEKLAGQLSAS